jgi:hypothetical protein
MMAVPRRSKRAADVQAETPVNGTLEPPMTSSDPADNGALPPTPASLPPPTNGPMHGAPIEGHDADGPGPRLAPDPGLYAVLGLEPSVSDAVIQTTYRRQASKLLGSGSNDNAALRQLNVAYEVLGTPVRRAEYDRLRLTQSSSGPPTPIRHGAKAAMRLTRRRRPRHAVQPRYAGFGDVLVVLMVVGLAAAAGFLIIPRVNINLSALNVLQNVLPLSNSSRRVIDTSVTPAPATAVPTATPRPGTAQRFVGSTVSVSNATPAQYTQENVVIRLRRDNQPAANFDVWAIVKYRTIEERWPATGSVKTDASGVATISFNIGQATPNREVPVEVVAQVEDQQLSWSTAFTPH